MENIENYLLKLLNNNLSLEEIEYVFCKKETMDIIIKSKYLGIIYKEILEKNSPKLNNVYLNGIFLEMVKAQNKLNKIYENIDDLDKELNLQPLFCDQTLLEIGEKNLEEYNFECVHQQTKYPSLNVYFPSGYTYWHFLMKVPKLKNQDLFF